MHRPESALPNEPGPAAASAGGYSSTMLTTITTVSWLAPALGGLCFVAVAVILVWSALHRPDVPHLDSTHWAPLPDAACPRVPGLSAGEWAFLAVAAGRYWARLAKADESVRDAFLDFVAEFRSKAATAYLRVYEWGIDGWNMVDTYRPTGGTVREVNAALSRSATLGSSRNGGAPKEEAPQ